MSGWFCFHRHTPAITDNEAGREYIAALGIGTQEDKLSGTYADDSINLEKCPTSFDERIRKEYRLQ
jgi:hypothetical protein